MLRNILTSDEINSIAQKHSDALKNYAKLYHAEKSKTKFKLLYPLKYAKFTLEEAKKFNFKASMNLWASCSNKMDRNLGGRTCLSEMIVHDINKHMTNNSSIAANRYLKKLKTNARYTNSTYIEAFNTFPMKNKLTFSTFIRKMKKKYKKPHRYSDLCDICEKSKVSS